jgi:hypothetical protein
VLFRPFPWETHNPQSFATSLEAAFIVYLMVKGRRRLYALPRALRREAYTAYCLGITCTFIYAFSAFSNFGILARQRVQVVPFFLVLICLNERVKRERVPLPSADIQALAAPAEDPYAKFDGDPDGEEQEPADANAPPTGASSHPNPNA